MGTKPIKGKTNCARNLGSSLWQVRVIDTQWFGNKLTPHDDLEVIKGDVRDIKESHFSDIESVVHLANIANDPSVDLNPVLSWEVNVLASNRIATMAQNNGVKQIIYASSGSVYGLNDADQVTEDLALVPISIYNKTKMVAERVFLSYSNQMQIHNIRPATVCGLSDRMRFDISVNMLTYQALENKKITVFGGKQVRPNIHIDDLVGVYLHFLCNPEIASGNYNAGFENLSIITIAEMASTASEAEIIVTESNDPRSYRQNSDKLLATGFSPRFSVDVAIQSLSNAYRNDGLRAKPEDYTVNWMKKLGLDTEG
jgi:nucleoside-diphosphate-sugar epimerase